MAIKNRGEGGRGSEDLFLSPPVHTARWAHMHRFLSVCPSVCLWLDKNSWTIIHISKTNEPRVILCKSQVDCEWTDLTNFGNILHVQVLNVGWLNSTSSCTFVQFCSYPPSNQFTAMGIQPLMILAYCCLLKEMHAELVAVLINGDWEFMYIAMIGMYCLGQVEIVVDNTHSIFFIY